MVYRAYMILHMSYIYIYTGIRVYIHMHTLRARVHAVCNTCRTTRQMIRSQHGIAYILFTYFIAQHGSRVYRVGFGITACGSVHAQGKSFAWRSPAHRLILFWHWCRCLAEAHTISVLSSRGHFVVAAAFLLGSRWYGWPLSFDCLYLYFIAVLF